jgi:hypothetical protein
MLKISVVGQERLSGFSWPLSCRYCYAESITRYQDSNLFVILIIRFGIDAVFYRQLCQKIVETGCSGPHGVQWHKTVNAIAWCDVIILAPPI